MRSIRGTAAVLFAVLTLADSASANEPGAPSAPAPAKISQSDQACLAEAVYFEAGSSQEALLAVAHVVVNRAEDSRFPRTICGVVRDGCQFSYRCQGRSLALRDPDRRERALRAAEKAMAGAPDPTGGALFFHAASANPGWFKSRRRVGAIGGNIFYR